MSFRRRMILLAAGAVAAAVLIASAIVYAVTRNELRGQIDTSLSQKLRPGAPQAVQIQAKSLTAADVREARRLARALAAGTAPNGKRVGPGAHSLDGGLVLYRTVTGVSRAARREPGAAIPLPDTIVGAGVGPAQGELSATVPTKAPGRRTTSVAPPRGNVSGVRLVLPVPKLGGPAGYAQLLTAEGNVLRSGEIGPGLPVSATTRAVAAGRRGAFFSDVKVAGTHVRMLTERAPIGGGVWQVALPLSSVDGTLANLRWLLAGVSLGGILLAAALGLLVSRAALVPVRRLTGAAEQVARTQDLGHRIPLEGQREELGRLAESFNTMLAALESSRLAQRQLVSDASHELRTPLTSVRANLDALAAGSSLSESDRARAIDAARAQLAELTVLVGDLVDLSKTGVESDELEDVRLDMAVTAAVERARARTADCGYVVHAEPCLVRAVPGRLDRAIANLLDNACKWGAASGPVEVEVGEGRLQVRDHGPGISDEDLPRVFDRFYRAPGARALPGSGLGLAIVRHFAETHGGSVHAASGPAGGARLTLELPVLTMTDADAPAESGPGLGQAASPDASVPAPTS